MVTSDQRPLMMWFQRSIHVCRSLHLCWFIFWTKLKVRGAIPQTHLRSPLRYHHPRLWNLPRQLRRKRERTDTGVGLHQVTKTRNSLTAAVSWQLSDVRALKLRQRKNVWGGRISHSSCTHQAIETAVEGHIQSK